MVITILGYIALVVVGLLVVAAVLLINTELFVYASYSYGRAEHALRIAVKLFRYWQLFARDYSGQEAKAVIEETASVIAETEQPQMAEVVRAVVDTPETTPRVSEMSAAVPESLSPAEPVFEMQQPITVAPTGKSASRERSDKTAEGAEDHQPKPDSKLYLVAKNELWNNPGRNVLLLLALLFDLKRLVGYLLKTMYRAFEIKKLEINSEFGAEDPFDTGQVAAVIYTSINSLSYVRRHKHIVIRFQPDFEKSRFEFDGDAIILVKATTALLKILGAIIGAILKGVFYYGGKIAWRLGPNYIRKPKESGIN